ncbi:Ig-like domain-containing protein [Treponema sp.]|uniref:Ig-like domain-containing protein n=1 Tax=Treponema sp. TaxID=166 RepID=UPI00298DD333|nr:Ig-like domain-containing protein [Treponema sp.]MCQ2240939.1 Ig-like domain-containing protein [Treponema sp.]
MDVKKVTRLFKISMAAGLLIPLFATLSCEIGLGESVDTEAPSVAITYPPVGAVIMEDFVLAGTYKDDKGIDEVSVTIKGTGLDNSDMELGPFKAGFDDKSWSIRLNEKAAGRSAFNGYPIKDGPIEITVSVRDGANHTTTEKLSVDIDNSAPVLIMSKPLSTATDESSTSYGRIFKLTGDIYDLHQSDGISVDFKYALNEGGVLGEAKTLNGYTINSSMTDDSPLIIAQYYTVAEAGNDESKKKNRENYLALYGNDADAGNGNTKDKEFYCGTILTDCARIYQNPSDGTGVAKGNSTDEYYINSNDFYNELQSESGTRGSGRNYEVTATKLGKMLNGTGNDYSEADKAYILEVLHVVGNHAPSKEIDVSRSSKFLINPDNSPVWNISGYEAGFDSEGKSVNSYDKAEDPDGFRDLAQGGSVSVNFAAGKDKSEIRPETLVVKLRHYKTNDFSGTPEDVLVLLDNTDYYKDFRKENAITENDLSTSLSVQFTPNSGAAGVATYKLNAGEYYIFDVSGYDRKGNDLCALKGNTYGFMVKRTEASPETAYTVCEFIEGARSDKDIFDENAGNGFVSGKNPIDISGTVNLQGDKFHESTPIQYTIELTRNGKSLSDASFGADARIPTPTVTIRKTQKSDVDSDWGINISDLLKAKTSGGTETTLVPGKYNVKIIVNVMNTTGAFSKDTITFTLDNKAPELSGETVTPTVKKNDVNYINGKVVYRATIRDNNEVSKTNKPGEDCTWEVEGVTPAIKGEAHTEELETTAINTRLITETTGTLTLKIKVADTVKNTAEYTREYNIDQTTDAPVIKAGNYKKDLAAADISANNNLLGKKSNNVLYATISDDDGLATVDVYYKPLGAGDDAYTQLGTSYNAAGSMSYSLEANVGSLDEGKYVFKIEAKDSLQETDYANTTETFNLGISNGAPEIAVTTENNKWQKSATDFTISGTCGSTADKVLRYDDEAGTQNEKTMTLNSGVWSYTTQDTAGKEYYYFAVDQYGQRSSVSHKYRIDSIAPTVKSDWTNTDAAENKWHASGSVALNIPLSDEWSGDASGSKIDSKSVSGIATVKYKIDDGDWSDMVLGNKVDSTATAGQEGYSYSFYKTTLSFPTEADGTVKNGDHTVSVKVVDDAGNELPLSYTYHIDTKAPVITELKLNGAVPGADTVLNASQVADGIRISAKVTDALDGISTSGIKEVKLLDNNKVKTIEPTVSSGVYTYLIPESEIGNGEHTYAIEATDKAGNVSDRSEFTVSVDKVAPKANISVVSPTVSAKKDGATVTYVNGIITVEGTASDETKLVAHTNASKPEVKSILSWVIDDKDTTDNYHGTVELTDETYSNWSFELDTRNIDSSSAKDSESTHIIKVSVADAAGNTFTSTEKEIIIKQYTDIPVVTFSDLEDSIAMNAAIPKSDKYSTFGGANSNINFTVSDDDKVQSVKVYLDDGSTPVYTWPTGTESPKSTVTISDFDLKKVSGINEGPHKIKLVVEDSELLNGDKHTYVTSLAYNGTTTEYPNDKNANHQYDFYYDTANPSLDETKVKVAGITTNKSFTLGGTTSDSYGVKEIKIQAEKSGETGVKDWETIPADKIKNNNWEIELKTSGKPIADGSYTVTITAIDLANKETKVIRPVIIDTTPPSLKDNKVTVKSARKFPDATEVSPEREWYNSSVLNVELSVKDDETGIKSVQWSYSGVADDESRSWSSLTSSGADGDYTKWAGTLLLRNDDGDVQGSNLIDFKIEDVAGNVYKLDSKYPTVNPWIDTKAPKAPEFVSVENPTETNDKIKIASTSADVVFIVNAKDDGLIADTADSRQTAVGIATVELAKIGSTTISSTQAKKVTVVQLTGTGNENKYKFTLDKALFGKTSEGGVGDGGDVIIKVTDKVGNSTTSDALFKIIVDNDAPEISLTDPADADVATDGIQVNGKISVTGKVTDSNSISAPEFKFYQGTAADPKTLTEDKWSPLTPETGASPKVVLAYTVSGAYNNWTLTVDTRSKFVDEKDYILRVAVKDIAGNTGYKYLVFKVDQNTDRPVIRVSSPNSFKVDGTDESPVLMSSASPVWQMGLNYISGTITDDDGVTGMYYSVDNGSSWSENIASNGTWQVKGLDDKNYAMLFKVEDKAGGEFISKATVDKSSSIRLTDGTNEPGNSIFYFAVDTKTPTISKLQYDFGTTKDVHAEKKPVSPEAGVTYLSDMLPGGKTSKFKLHLYAKDANGINSVVVANDKLGTAANGHTMALTEVAGSETAADGVKYTTSEIDISTWESGTYQFTITVTDNAGSQAVTNTSITVDNDAPTVSISNPEEGKSVYGISVSAMGSVSDAKKLYYAISTEGKANENDKLATSVSEWTTYKDADNKDVAPTKDGDANYAKLGNHDNATFAEDPYKPVYKLFDECSGAATFKGTQWNLYFDGKEDITGETHVYRVNKWLTEMGVTSDTLIKNKSFEDLVNLWLWIKAEDNAGNVSETAFRIVVDPQGGRPSAEIATPKASDKVTGNVRVSGTASDPDGKVKKVFVQFISEQHSMGAEEKTKNSGYSTSVTVVDGKVTKFAPTVADIRYLISAGIEVYNFRAATPVKVESIPDTANPADYAALADYKDTGTWSITVNENDEFVPAPDSDGNATTNKVVFAVYAIDDEGFISTPVYSIMEFDTEAPAVDNLELVKYGLTGGNIDKSKEIARKTYSEDMYINDTWYLEGTVKDDTVYSLSVLGEKLVVKGNGPTSTEKLKTVDVEKANTIEWIKKETINGVDYHTYRFSVKLDATAKGETGVFSGAINASDQAGHQGRSNVTINVDRKAPVILAKGENEKYNINPLIQNEDGFYTFGSQVTEEGNQAGFERVAFYFMRRNSGESKDKHYLYDIMLDKTENANRTEVTSLPSDMVFEDGLYWRKQTVTVDNTRTVISGTFNTDVYRVGSLVKINGSYYIVIDNRTSGSLTLSEKIPGTETSVTGLFAVAQIVDHLTQETAGTSKLTSTTGGINGYFSNNINEDYVDGDTRLGDFMVESVKKKGATWTWDASVNSKNIPDGPIELHYVVFDAAGNYSIEVIGHEDAVNAVGAGKKPYSGLDKEDAHLRYRKDDIAIANNAPRLAKIFLGTDLDGDEKYQASEFVEYNAMEKLGKLSSTVEIETKKYNGKYFKIKDKFAVMPEFVGGNGVDADHKIKAVFNNNATTAAVNTGTGDSLLAPAADDAVLDIDGSEIAAEKDAIDSGKTYNVEGDLEGLKYHMYVYTFANDKLGDESADPETGDRKMSWTFWDYTEDTEIGVDSSYCHVWIKDLVVDVLDDTSPIAKILPFHWTSPTDNSVPVDENGNVLGHIDLEEDLGAPGARVEKPKVSGRVYIDGITYDATRLKALFMKGPNGEAKKVAEYYNGKWIAASRNASGGIVYTDMSGAPATPSSQWANGSSDGAKWPANWYGFTINSEDRPSQDGHTVTWTFDIDMTPYGVATNKSVIAYAEDAREYTAEEKAAGKKDGNQSSSVAAGQTGYNATAADKKGDYTSTYKMDFVPYIKGIEGATRSRLGRYAVQAGSKVKLEIMNAKKNDKVGIKFYATGADGKQGDEKSETHDDVTTGEGGIVEITVPQYSCFVEATVDDVQTPNNINTNHKYNIEAGYSVDRLGREQGDPKNGTNYWTDDRYLSVWNVVSTIPSNKHAKPTAGMFVKSTVDKISRIRSNGTETKNNQAPNNAVKDVLIATWGSSDELQMFDYPIGSGATTVGNTAYAQSEACFFEAPPQLDTCIINGVPWYVVLDNYAGGNSANEWGAGLYIARQGFSFGKANFKATTSQHPYIIEAQGKEGKHDMTGVDEKKNQFINPHIAGWFNSSDNMYYMYMSYYDTYARCLKYAAYKEKINKDNEGALTAASWQDYKEESSAGAGNLVGMMNGHVIKASTGSKTIQGTGANVVAGNDVYDTGVSSWAEQVGEYNDILIDPTDNVPVIVYYNKSKGGLQIARASGAFTTIAQAPGSGEAGAKTWVYTGKDNVIRPSGVNSDFGRYVSAEVGDKGNLHIAAQEVNSGKLYYLYMTKSGNTYELTNSYIVDSTSAVGNWTDIHLGKDDANSSNWYEYEPVISYLDKSNLNTTSAAKVAWVEITKIEGSVVANWEAMTDPAKYEGTDNKTSVAASPSEGKSGIKSKLAIGFNSDYYAVDFLRGE